MTSFRSAVRSADVAHFVALVLLSAPFLAALASPLTPCPLTRLRLAPPTATAATLSASPASQETNQEGSSSPGSAVAAAACTTTDHHSSANAAGAAGAADGARVIGSTSEWVPRPVEGQLRLQVGPPAPLFTLSEAQTHANNPQSSLGGDHSPSDSSFSAQDWQQQGPRRGETGMGVLLSPGGGVGAAGEGVAVGARAVPVGRAAGTTPYCVRVSSHLDLPSSLKTYLWDVLLERHPIVRLKSQLGGRVDVQYLWGLLLERHPIVCGPLSPFALFPPTWTCHPLSQNVPLGRAAGAPTISCASLISFALLAQRQHSIELTFESTQKSTWWACVQYLWDVLLERRPIGCVPCYAWEVQLQRHPIMCAPHSAFPCTLTIMHLVPVRCPITCFLVPCYAMPNAMPHTIPHTTRLARHASCPVYATPCPATGTVGCGGEEQAAAGAVWGGAVGRESTQEGRVIGIMLTLGGLFFYSLLTSTMTTQFKECTCSCAGLIAAHPVPCLRPLSPTLSIALSLPPSPSPSLSHPHHRPLSPTLTIALSPTLTIALSLPPSPSPSLSHLRHRPPALLIALVVTAHLLLPSRYSPHPAPPPREQLRMDCEWSGRGKALILSALELTSTSPFTARPALTPPPPCEQLRMEWLREGAHSQVMECDHIVIGGINNRLATLLRQLSKSQHFAVQDGSAVTRWAGEKFLWC
ncbi:unnamed protein product [Closterium sp. NIES-65]|nr:unnamed protein product [Closterium sp. NIES-65]